MAAPEIISPIKRRIQEADNTGTKIGTALGLAAGVVASVATGGTAAPAIMSAAGGGGALGGAVGSFFNKDKSSVETEPTGSVPSAGTPVERRLQGVGGNMPSLQAGLQNTKFINDPQVRNEAEENLRRALELERQRTRGVA